MDIYNKMHESLHAGISLVLWAAVLQFDHQVAVKHQHTEMIHSSGMTLPTIDSLT